MQDVQGRRDIRRSHEARANFWHVTIVSSFFVIVLGASVFLGVVMVIGTLRGETSSNELTADGRTGRIARTLLDGTFCRYIMFDNKTAQAVEDRIGRCDESKAKSRNRSAIFSWGGR
jgi:hypothetical protein